MATSERYRQSCKKDVCQPLWSPAGYCVDIDLVEGKDPVGKKERDGKDGIKRNWPKPPRLRILPAVAMTTKRNGVHNDIALHRKGGKAQEAQ